MRRRLTGDRSPRPPSLLPAAALFLAVPALLLGQEEDAAAIRERARQVVSRGGYQSSLDVGRAEEEAPARRSPSSRTWNASGPRAAGAPMEGVGRAALYTVLAVLAVLAAVAITRMLLARSSSGRGAPAARGQPPAAAPGAVPAPAAEVASPLGKALEEADLLAEAGRREEAAHRLLLAAIGHLSAELGRPRSSRTSRELVGQFALEEERRGAFRELVLAVESAVFGGKPLDPRGYACCRRALECLGRGAAA